MNLPERVTGDGQKEGEEDKEDIIAHSIFNQEKKKDKCVQKMKNHTFSEPVSCIGFVYFLKKSIFRNNTKKIRISNRFSLNLELLEGLNRETRMHVSFFLSRLTCEKNGELFGIEREGQ